MRKPPNAGKGRSKGVPNKLTADLKQMILGALAEAGGEAYLKEQAQKNPPAFLSLLARLLPKQVEANVQANFAGYEPVRIPVEERDSDRLAGVAFMPAPKE